MPNMEIMVGGEKPLSQIVQPLLQWYAAHARALPWREDSTPYRVWVSEIMLQQTRVNTAIGYFNRFVRELPDVQALAAVPEDKLLKLWEGLGYYNRARNMRRAAQVIMEELEGAFPQSYEGWLALPGVGRYTAGAVMSIAYGQPYPAVDGNVLRVLARLRADKTDIALPTAKAQGEKLLGGIIPADNAPAFTQAMMELGATVCIPSTQPHCEICPLMAQCRAHAQGKQAVLPVKTAKKRRRLEKKTVLLLVHNGNIALIKRPAHGLLAGLWELPNWEGWLTAKDVEAWLHKHRLTANCIAPLEETKHIFTHVEWHMRAYEIELTGAEVAKELVWVTARQLTDTYSVPSAFKKYVEYFLQQKTER